jgi:adenylosuccinate lyase
VDAKMALRSGAAENDLVRRIREDEAFAAVRDDLDEILDAKAFVGRAPAQVNEFLGERVEPVLERYRDRLGKEGEVRV